MKTINRNNCWDPSGAGPEICLKALMKDEIYQICRPILFGDEKVIKGFTPS